ncbi:hypothetical protein FOZ63_029046, partial [Perkinsus olseni]
MVIRSSSRQAAEISVGAFRFDRGTPTTASLGTVLYFRDEQAEEERISALRAEDPIAWQDCYVSSLALRKACEAGLKEDVKEILAAAHSGDFVPSLVHSAFLDACVVRLDVEIARILVHHGGLRVKGVPGNENLVHRVCERATPEDFTKAKHMLQTLVVDLSMDINACCTLKERPDMFGYTALALAVRWRNPPLAFELLALGADPNKGHRSGCTPLGILQEVDPRNTIDKESVVILRNLLEARGGKLKSSVIGKDTPAAVYVDLQDALALREKYIGVGIHDYSRGNRRSIELSPHIRYVAPNARIPGFFVLEEGVYHIYSDPENPTEEDMAFEIPTLGEYYEDMNTLFRIRTSGPTASFSFLRLRMLETKFELYGMTCAEQENTQCGAIPHRDFYNVRKVDTHIHHSAAMNAKHLLRFIKRKVANHPDDEVLPGETLGQVFDQLGVKPYDLSLDKLNVLADKSTLY